MHIFPMFTVEKIPLPLLPERRRGHWRTGTTASPPPTASSPWAHTMLLLVLLVGALSLHAVLVTVAVVAVVGITTLAVLVSQTDCSSRVQGRVLPSILYFPTTYMHI